MKKYLFLLFLFVIYLIIIIKPKTSNVFLSNEMNKNGVSSYTINFDLGINSNDLKKIFDLYDNDFLITNINDFNVKCSNFNDCIKEIYEQENISFEINYLINGFKINSIEIITYDDINNFLFENKIVHSIY